MAIGIAADSASPDSLMLEVGSVSSAAENGLLSSGSETLSLSSGSETRPMTYAPGKKKFKLELVQQHECEDGNYEEDDDYIADPSDFVFDEPGDPEILCRELPRLLEENKSWTDFATFDEASVVVNQVEQTGGYDIQLIRKRDARRCFIQPAITSEENLEKLVFFAMAAVKHENRRRGLFSKKLGRLRLTGIIKAMTHELCDLSCDLSGYYLTLKVMELEGGTEVERTYEALVQEKKPCGKALVQEKKTCGEALVQESKPCGRKYFTQFRLQGTSLAYRHTVDA